MTTGQHGIDLATRIQRRYDFTAHATGFLSGAIILASLLFAGVSSATLYITTILTWATALSFQHFRHVLRGPVTAADVEAETTRPASARRAQPVGQHREHPLVQGRIGAAGQAGEHALQQYDEISCPDLGADRACPLGAAQQQVERREQVFAQRD